MRIYNGIRRYFDIILENMEMQAKVGKCTGMEKSCLEMGSYDTP